MSKQKNDGLTWAEAVRDIVAIAINKGQLLPLGLIMIVLLILLRVPEDQILVLLRALVKKLEAGELMVYPLLVICISGWIYHVAIMRRHFKAEYERIGKEKSRLQSELSGIELKSSD